MPLAALALVLAAAVAHAAWNLYAKRARGGIACVWLGGVGAVTLYAIPAAAQLALGSRSLATSVIAALLGAHVLGEGERRRRMLAAVAIVAGIALLAAG